MLRPENGHKQYDALFLGIDSGQIKLPMFQRDFVWNKEQTAKLIDSILKGFPIGTFIFWQTQEVLRSYKDIGNHELPSTPRGDYSLYILDGQQRITSLYAIRKGIRIEKDGEEIDYKDIYIDLDADPSKDEPITVTSHIDGRQYVSVHDLLNKRISVLFNDFPSKHTLIEDYRHSLTNYNFSTIVIKDYPIEVACEVFARINTGGKALALFEIMVAMTYDEKRKFDLGEKCDELIWGTGEGDDCLAKAKYESVSATTIMQVVAAITTGSVRAKDILKIKREKFIGNWEPAKDSIFRAVDCLRTELGVPVSQLLPYPILIVPFAYFFHRTKNKKASPAQLALLRQFFYWAGITNRYNSAADSKIAEDLKNIDSIVKGKPLPQAYPPGELHVQADSIRDTWFSTKNAFCKTVLCLLASQHPKTIDTNGDVILDNSNLKIASSRNYHHFFPKSYLNKKNSGIEANLVANITLINADSNFKIAAKAPSVYIGAIAKTNNKLKQGLKTHLIADPTTFGIYKDDYATFLAERSALIAKHINEHLNPADHGSGSPS